MPEHGGEDVELRTARLALYDARPDLDGYTPDEAYERGIDKALAALVGFGRLCSRHGQGCHSRCSEPMVTIYRLADSGRIAPDAP